MQADVIAKVSAAVSLKELFQAVGRIDEKRAVIRFFNPQEGTVGELWIADKGETIVGACSYVSDKQGYAALWEMLNLPGSRFELMRAVVKGPDEFLHVSIPELLDDRANALLFIQSAAENPVGQDKRRTASSEAGNSAAQSARPGDALKLPARFEKDDLADKRRFDIAMARTSEASAPLADPTASYSVGSDVDDFETRRLADLHEAKVNPPSLSSFKEQNTQELPAFAREKAAPPPKPSAAPKLDPLLPDFGLPTASMQSSPDTSHTNLKRFSEWKRSAEKGKPAEAGIELKDFGVSKQHIKTEENETPKGMLLALLVPGVALPLLVVLSIGAAFADAHMGYQAEQLITWEVNQAMDEGSYFGTQTSRYGIASAPPKDIWEYIGDWIGPLHNPFRPPEVLCDQTSPAVAKSSVGDGKQQEQVDTQAVSAPDCPWLRPNSARTKLAPPQQADRDQCKRTGDAFAERGQWSKAAQVYAAALARYPGDVELRVAAIHAFMRARRYAQARTLAVDGARTAPTYKDYLVFYSLYRNIPAG